MEKEKWMQEFEKKQSRKRGYEEEDLAGEEDDSQFFRMADKTLMRMTSKDDTGINSLGVAESVAKLPVQEKVFKSPLSKFGPLQPLQNMVSLALL